MLLTEEFATRKIQGRARGVAISCKVGCSHRINVGNLEGYSIPSGKTLDLVCTEGRMRRLRRASGISPCVRGDWGCRSEVFAC